MTPPSNMHAHAHHQSEEVWFHAMENLIGNALILGAASRLLGDEELLQLMSAEDPPMFADAEHDQH